eukprot:SAG22_NODE_2540_length_2463_cov_5.358714_4_plen_38_part_00
MLAFILTSFLFSFNLVLIDMVVGFYPGMFLIVILQVG